ncbi:MAG: M12 family metallo-peptidase, partial [Balneolales bacterium]
MSYYSQIRHAIVFVVFFLLLALNISQDKNEWLAVNQLATQQVYDDKPRLFKVVGPAKVNSGVLERDHIQKAPVDFNDEVLWDIEEENITDFVITIFNDQDLMITISRVTKQTNGSWSATGRADDMAMNTFTMSSHEGGVIAQFDDLNGQHIEFRFDSALQRHFMYQLDPAEQDNLNCDIELLPENGIIDRDTDKSEPEKNRDTEEADIIDIMIVYTPAASDWAIDRYSSIETVVSQSMINAQNALDNSDINLEFRLVHSTLVKYTESGNSRTDLRRLTHSPDNSFGADYGGYMEEVHEWRDQHNADLVALFTHVDDVGGVAWVLNNHSGSPTYGFSITRVQQAATGFTHAHEIGHNMGSQHSRIQNSNPASNTGGLHDYSTGWRWIDSDSASYASVMTYREFSTQVPIFSNPDKLWADTPSGSYEGAGAPADNARSMRSIKSVIAAYRTKPDTSSLALFSSGPHTTGKEYWVDVWVGDSMAVEGLFDLSVKLQYGSTTTSYVNGSAQAGDFLGISVSGLFSQVDDQTVEMAVTRSSGIGNDGKGIVMRAQFISTAPGPVEFELIEVTGRDATGKEIFFEVSSLEVNVEDGGSPPGVIFLSSPVNELADVASFTDFEWELDEETMTYQFQLATDSDFETLVLDLEEIQENTLSLEEPLQYLANYYWRVRGINTSGKGDWSEAWSFTTIVAQPDVVVLGLPGDDEIDLVLSPEFIWNAVTFADTYDFQLSTNDAFSNIVFASVANADTSISLQVDLREFTQYYWRVRAANDAGAGDWGKVRSFTTKTVISITEESDLPNKVTLNQNYPNPFNPSTTIEYGL